MMEDEQSKNMMTKSIYSILAQNNEEREGKPVYYNPTYV